MMRMMSARTRAPPAGSQLTGAAASRLDDDDDDDDDVDMMTDDDDDDDDMMMMTMIMTTTMTAMTMSAPSRAPMSDGALAGGAAGVEPAPGRPRSPPRVFPRRGTLALRLPHARV